jgi:hypothetical protein
MARKIFQRWFKGASCYLRLDPASQSKCATRFAFIDNECSHFLESLHRHEPPAVRTCANNIVPSAVADGTLKRGKISHQMLIQMPVRPATQLAFYRYLVLALQGSLHRHPDLGRDCHANQLESNGQGRPRPCPVGHPERGLLGLFKMLHYPALPVRAGGRVMARKIFQRWFKGASCYQRLDPVSQPKCATRFAFHR